MSIARLKKLIPPPEHPTEIGTNKQWEAVEKELGTPLPEDYREFVFAYGTGLFANLYRVLNPFSVSKYSAIVPVLEMMRGSWDQIESPYPLFPDQGGILSWGNDENGNEYFWLVKGKPDEWKVVQNNTRGTGFKEQKCSMSEFLVGILEKKIKPLASGGYPRKECFKFKSFTPEKDE